MIIYIDESGFQKTWTFAAVKIQNENDARLCINRWRRYAKSASSKFSANEYRDCKTPDRQRRQILQEIASMAFPFWVLQFNNYRNHKLDYSGAIFQLLQEIDLMGVNHIMVDKVVRGWKHMEKHVEIVRSKMNLACPVLHGNSEKEKGIQVADAICGAASRKFNNLAAPSYFELIEHLMVGYKSYK
jgi:hypothetical protein